MLTHIRVQNTHSAIVGVNKPEETGHVLYCGEEHVSDILLLEKQQTNNPAKHAKSPVS